MEDSKTSQSCVGEFAPATLQAMPMMATSFSGMVAMASGVDFAHNNKIQHPRDTRFGDKAVACMELRHSDDARIQAKKKKPAASDRQMDCGRSVSTQATPIPNCRVVSRAWIAV